MAEEHHVVKALRMITEPPEHVESQLGATKTARRERLQQAADEQDLSNLYMPPGLLTWMQSESIEAIGVAERVTAGTKQRDVTLKVYVERKLPMSKCDHVIPKVLNIEGMPPIDIDVEEIGRIELHGNTTRVRPAVPGFSIGRAIDTQVAGTFGMLVRKKGTTEPVYILSNSHAIADSGMATKGDIIVQPGAYDGGTAAKDAVGKLDCWVPFVFSATGFPNLVDCAIAEVDPGLATAAIAQLGVPTGVDLAPKRGMEVAKVGRTSTFSVAQVKDVHLSTPSTYPQSDGTLGRVGFSDQILVSFYSTGGDSGSAVLNQQNEVVGLHFAGSQTIGVANKIANVMDALDIEVVTGPVS